MSITLLLILMLVVTVSWVTLGSVREQAIVQNAHVHDALRTYMEQETILKIHQQHEQTVRLLSGREDQSHGQIEPPKLAEWVKEYIDVQEDTGGFAYTIKSSFGSYLASVPVLWFHGSFAILNILLIVLCLVSIGNPISGT